MRSTAPKRAARSAALMPKVTPTSPDHRTQPGSRSRLSSLWRGAGGEVRRPLLAAASLALLIAGAACSSANNGYGAQRAAPAAAATQIAATQLTAGASPAFAVRTPAVPGGTSAPDATPTAGAATTPQPATPSPAAAPLAVGISGFAFGPATLHVP